MNPLSSTIAAVSTPRGRGGIAVIRISGTDALSVAERMFTPASRNAVRELPERFAAFGDILDSDGDVCDSGICTVFRAPRSFTGEDVVELSCHGGTAVTEAVLLSAIAHGATMADAGEFTKRAFLNGKLSLTEAEAVGRLIDADTTERRRLAGGAARGNVSRALDRLSASLLDVMTALYAAIDYPEEDVGDEGERHIGEVLRSVSADVRRLLSTYRTGRAVQTGVRCVICGRPNVGKSSLFNRIVGDEAAIVTSVAGTTRDVLRETASFGGVTLRLSDTAGIHESSDEVERLGIERAYGELEGAELVLAVWNGAEPLNEQDEELLMRLGRLGGDGGSDGGVAIIGVINKLDLCDKGSGESIIDEGRIAEVCGGTENVVRVSCANERGIDELAAVVARRFGSDGIDLRHDAVIWDVRQRTQLLRADAALTAALGGLMSGDPLDAVCTLVEEAMAALSETDGRGVNEEIVTEIFSRFCVGK